VTLTTPISGLVWHPWARTTYLSKVCISTGDEDMAGDAKCRKWGGLGYLWATEGHWT